MAAGRTLLMAYPDEDASFAADAVARYGGERLVYVGERRGGCCASDAFFDAMAAGWEVEARRPLGYFHEVADEIVAWRRRGTGKGKKAKKRPATAESCAALRRFVLAGGGKPRNPSYRGALPRQQHPGIICRFSDSRLPPTPRWRRGPPWRNASSWGR